MSDETFDFEAERKRWPNHWERDENGWPARMSTWRARIFPHLRVRVMSRKDEYVEAWVYWDGDRDGLRRLFTHEQLERWEIGKHGLVQMPEGIGPWEQNGPSGEGRYWRKREWELEVIFERALFGGPDTWHYGRDEWESLPFFEPVPEWDPNEANFRGELAE
jgi:hypothetical protein